MHSYILTYDIDTLTYKACHITEMGSNGQNEVKRRK